MAYRLVLIAQLILIEGRFAVSAGGSMLPTPRSETGAMGWYYEFRGCYETANRVCIPTDVIYVVNSIYNNRRFHVPAQVALSPLMLPACL